LASGPGSKGAGSGATVSGSTTAATLAVPAVQGVDPVAGPLSGGTQVTITGENLANATVAFGKTTVPPSSIVSDTATSIVVDSPPAKAGTVDVTVTTALGGASQTSAADKFTYVAAPVITGIKPAAGSTMGKTSVTITGKNLADATVTFGTNLVTTITSDTAGKIVLKSPAGTVGPVNVTVATVGGTATRPDGFTYQATPADVYANNAPFVPDVNDLALLDLLVLSSPIAGHG
jgi:hypothetical protein